MSDKMRTDSSEALVELIRSVEGLSPEQIKRMLESVAAFYGVKLGDTRLINIPAPAIPRIPLQPPFVGPQWPVQHPWTGSPPFGGTTAVDNYDPEPASMAPMKATEGPFYS